MKIETTCGCGAKFRADSEQASQKMTCSSCGAAIQIAATPLLSSNALFRVKKTTTGRRARSNIILSDWFWFSCSCCGKQNRFKHTIEFGGSGSAAPGAFERDHEAIQLAFNEIVSGCVSPPSPPQQGNALDETTRISRSLLFRLSVLPDSRESRELRRRGFKEELTRAAERLKEGAMASAPACKHCGTLVDAAANNIHLFLGYAMLLTVVALGIEAILLDAAFDGSSGGQSRPIGYLLFPPFALAIIIGTYLWCFRPLTPNSPALKRRRVAGTMWVVDLLTVSMCMFIVAFWFIAFTEILSHASPRFGNAVATRAVGASVVAIAFIFTGRALRKVTTKPLALDSDEYVQSPPHP